MKSPFKKRLTRDTKRKKRKTLLRRGEQKTRKR